MKKHKNQRESNLPLRAAQKRAWIGRLMEAVWLLVLFLVPLVFIPNIFTTFELAKVVVFKGLTALLFPLWVLRHFLAGESPALRWKSHKYLWFWGGIFLAVYALTTLVSVAPAMSFFGWYPRFQGLMTLASYALFGVVVFFELRSPKQKERLIFVLLAGFFLTCSIALLQKFSPGFLQWWDDAQFNGRIYGTLANPNYLAGYIVMILPLLMANFFRKKWVVFSAVCLGAGIPTLIFTLSRAGFVAFLLSFVFFLSVAAYKRKAKKTLAALVVFPLIVAGFVWYVAAHREDAWVKNIPFFDRLTTSEENMTSTRTRLEIWPATVRQILASPLIGYGPETYAITFPAFAPDTVNTREDAGEIADHAHNELLDWGVQIGIPGTFAYLCFVLGLILAGTRRFLRKNGPDSWVILGLSSGLLGLFAANQFGFSVTVHWVFFTLFAALILNTLHEKDFETVSFSLGKLWKAAIFIVVCAAGLGMFWLHDVRSVEADAHMRTAYDLIQANNLGNSQNSEEAASDTFLQGLVSRVKGEFEAAAGLAPTEAFYSINLAHFVLGRLYEGEKFSSVEISEALDRAAHAARWRGVGGFCRAVARGMCKGQ